MNGDRFLMQINDSELQTTQPIWTSSFKKRAKINMKEHLQCISLCASYVFRKWVSVQLFTVKTLVFPLTYLCIHVATKTMQNMLWNTH